MSDIYVFGPNDEENDYASFGLVGALDATEVTFKETGNGESTVSLSHPLDEGGKYLKLVRGNILKVPVPVRTTPEIQNGSLVEHVYKATVKSQGTSKQLRTLYKKKTGTAAVRVLKANEAVTVVDIPLDEEAKWKVKTSNGTGYVFKDCLNDEKTEVDISSIHDIEMVQSPWTVTDQEFRIYSVKEGINSISVEARHISYDLLYATTIFQSTGTKTLNQALEGIMQQTFWATASGVGHSFEAFTNVTASRAGLLYRNSNVINALLDPENGVAKKFDVSLVRDNHSLYFLENPGMNRGIVILYGKNMTGVDVTDSDDEVATRIIPVGENKDGTPLYLVDNDSSHPNWYKESGVYIESDKVGSYPYPKTYILECEGCKIGDKDPADVTITKTIARQMMREQAEKLLAEKCDEPKIEMSVEFVNLGDTEEYAQFKNLENCYLFDIVYVRHPKFPNIDITAQILSIEWDCLLDRMKSVEINSVGKTLENTGVTTWQIPSGFSGMKIANETIDSKSLKDDIISARHIQSDSIETRHITAGSIDVDRLDALSVTAQKAIIGALNASSIEATAGKIDQLTAIDIYTDALAAAFAKFFDLQVTTLRAEEGTVDHLTSKVLDIQDGIAVGDVSIKNLYVENASIRNGVLDTLVVKGSDDHYYQLQITEGNGISYEDVTDYLEDSEQSLLPGAIVRTEDGLRRQIIETAMDIQTLAVTGNFEAAQGIIHGLEADTIDVTELTANTAQIGKLIAAQIFGANGSLQVVAERAADSFAKLSTYFDFNENGLTISKKDSEGVRSPWSTNIDNQGFRVRNSNTTGIAGTNDVFRATESGVVTNGLQIGDMKVRKTKGGWVWTDGV